MSAALRALGPAVVWAIVIFAFSSRPTLPVELGSGHDKLAHFGAYAVLGLTLGGVQRYYRWTWRGALALGLFYAFTDELHQSLVPGRSPDAADWIADALGIMAGLFLFHRWRRLRAGWLRSSRDALADSSS